MSDVVIRIEANVSAAEEACRAAVAALVEARKALGPIHEASRDLVTSRHCGDQAGIVKEGKALADGLARMRAAARTAEANAAEAVARGESAAAAGRESGQNPKKGPALASGRAAAATAKAVRAGVLAARKAASTLAAEAEWKKGKHDVAKAYDRLAEAEKAAEAGARAAAEAKIELAELIRRTVAVAA